MRLFKCCFVNPWVLGTAGCENVVPKNWRTAKGKTPHCMADGSSWALSTGTGGVNWTLWFCPIRARSNGKLFYRKEQRGDWGGAGFSASVEGTAGRLVARGCSQLLAGEEERTVLFSKTLSFGPSLHPMLARWTLPRQDRAAAFTSQMSDVV